jgi:hypothetical protein
MMSAKMWFCNYKISYFVQLYSALFLDFFITLVSLVMNRSLQLMVEARSFLTMEDTTQHIHYIVISTQPVQFLVLETECVVCKKHLENSGNHFTPHPLHLHLLSHCPFYFWNAKYNKRSNFFSGITCYKTIW